MSNTTSTIRTFIAVELPPPVRALLGVVQAELRESMGRAANSVKWVRPESTHLTLQFLGDVRADQLGQIEAGIKQASSGITPFKLNVHSLGVFPNLRRPRVVWVGLEGDAAAMGALRSLHAAIGSRMKPMGFEPDSSFKPHLTLGRVRESATPADLAAISDTFSYPEAQPNFETTFEVRGVSLIKSDLQSGGAVYTQLAHVELLAHLRQ